MKVSRILGWLGTWLARHAGATSAVALILAVTGAFFAFKAQPQAPIESLLDPSSPESRDTKRFEQQFGSGPVYVLIQGKLDQLLLSSDLLAILSFEGCIAGNVPEGSPPPKGVCAELAELKPAKVVYGPGTFINQSAVELSAQIEKARSRGSKRAKKAAKAARHLALAQGRTKKEADALAKKAEELAYAEFVRDSLSLALKYGLRSLPQIDNPAFVSRVVFDPKRGAGVPKPRFSYLFPSKESALIQIRLRPDLSQSERKEAVRLIRETTEESGLELENGDYVVTGPEVVSQDLAAALSEKMRLLLLLAVVVMGVVLLVSFHVRRRLLPLLLAVLAVAFYYGILDLAGVELTLTAVAAMPLIFGLAVDYAVQYQARFSEEQRARGRPDSVSQAARLGMPLVAGAWIVSLAGMLALLFAPVPAVRDFGAVLVAGIGTAFLYVFFAGSALMAGPGWSARRLDVRPVRAVRGRLTSLWASLGQIVASSSIACGVRNGTAGVARCIFAISVDRPGTVLLVASIVAVSGAVLSTQISTTADLRQLVPEDQPALKGVNALEAETGISGEIDVTLRGRNATDPKVIGWLAGYEERVLKRHGYKKSKGCKGSDLCPGFSITRLIEGGEKKDRQVEALIKAIPPYFRSAIIADDDQAVNLVLGIPVMDLGQQEDLIKDLKRTLHPPKGVTASVSGLPVIAAKASSEIESSRHWLTLAALAFVLIMLALIYRSPMRAIVPFVPVVMAVGWSGLLLYALGVKLNPFTVTLTVIVVAISTEFSVILSGRYLQQRKRGGEPVEALAHTFSTTGRAVLASALTAVAGFGVLTLSNIQILRDFGFVSVVDLAVSLVGVAIVLPATVQLWERHSQGRPWMQRGSTR